MVETKTNEPITHYLNVESVEQERVLCQKHIILQYDEQKIDEKKLATKLKDLKSASENGKFAIKTMHELCDKA